MKYNKRQVIGIYDGKPNKNGIIMNFDSSGFYKDKEYPIITKDEALSGIATDTKTAIGSIKLEFDEDTKELYVTELTINDGMIPQVNPYICGYGIGKLVGESEFSFSVCGVFLAPVHANERIKPYFNKDLE